MQLATMGRPRLTHALRALALIVSAATASTWAQSGQPPLLPSEVAELSEEALLTKWSELAERRRQIRAAWNHLQQQHQQATGQRRRQIYAQFQQSRGLWEQQIGQLTSQLQSLSTRVYHFRPNDLEAASLAVGRMVDDCRYEEARTVCQRLAASGLGDPSFLNASAAVRFAFHDFAKAEQLLKSAAKNKTINAANQPRLAMLSTCALLWKNEQVIRQREAAAQGDQRLPRVLLTTTQGDIELELFEDQAPNTVANFIRLVEDQQYDQTLFSKQSFVGQVVGGDLVSRPDTLVVPGLSVPGFTIPCECYRTDARRHFRGSLTMKHEGRDKGNAPFSICLEPLPPRDPGPFSQLAHTVFGRVVRGMDVAENLSWNDRIVSAKVLRKRAHAYEPRRVVPTYPLAEQLSGVEAGAIGQALTDAETDWNQSRRRHGEKHAETLAAANHWGMVLLAAGKHDEAQRQFDTVWQQRRSVLGERHYLTAEAMNNLAVAHGRAGRISAAKALFEQSLAVRRAAREIGEYHLATAQSHENLAFSLLKVGRHDLAQPHFDQAKKILQVNLSRPQLACAARSAYLVDLMDVPVQYPMLITLFFHPAAGETFLEQIELPKTLPAACVLTRYGMVCGAGAASGSFEARIAFHQAAEIRAQLLGPDHFQTALSLCHNAVHALAASEFTAPRSRGLGTNYRQVAHCASVLRRTTGEDSHYVVYAEMLQALCLMHDPESFDVTQTHLRNALDIVRKNNGQTHPQTAQLIEMLGLAAYAANRFGDALPHFETALEIHRQTLGPDHPRTAATLNAIGDTYYQRGEYRQALARLDEALRIRLDRLGARHSDTAMSLNDMGVIAKTQGQYTVARRHLESAVESLLAVHSPYATTARDNLLVLQLEMGDLKAKQYFQGRLRDPNFDGDRVALLTNLGTIARVEADYASAQQYFEQALQEGFPNDPSLLNSLGAVARDRGDLARAQGYFDQVLKIAAESPWMAADDPQLVLTRVSLGLLYNERGDYAAAETSFAEAMKSYRRSFGPHHPRTIALLRFQGETAFLRGDYLTARQRLADALDRKLYLAQDVLPAMSEAEALAFVAALAERDPLLTTYRHLENVSPAEVYRTVWKTRALATRALSARRDLAAQGSAPAAWDQLRTVRKELSSLILVQHAFEPFANVLPNVQSREQQIQELTQKKEQLEHQLARQLEPFRQQQRLLEVDVLDFVRQLPDNVAVADLVKVDVWRAGSGQPADIAPSRSRRVRQYDAFVLQSTPDDPGYRVDWIHLGPSEPIETAVDKWRAEIVAGAGGAGEGHASEVPGDTSPSVHLRRSVWDKLENAFQSVDTVVIIPDAALTRVPWQALPGRKPNTYLLHDYAVATATHGQQVALLFEKEPSPATQQLVAGGILYDQKPTASEVPTSQTSQRGPVRSPATRTQWTYLKGTLDEIDLIADLCPENNELVRLDKLDASESAIADRLPEARLIHLATHGFFTAPETRSAIERRSGQDIGETVALGQVLLTQSIGRNPLTLTGLVLAGANLPRNTNRYGLPVGEDGILTGEEVVDLDLGGTELVVLSACETGLGAVAGGEGVFGLQRAFGLAGARTVVASLWQVDDLATQALMGAFYRNLWHEERGKLESLRQAQLEMLESYDRQTGSLRGLKIASPRTSPRPRLLPPKYWAAFTLCGDWR